MMMMMVMMMMMMMMMVMNMMIIIIIIIIIITKSGNSLGVRKQNIFIYRHAIYRVSQVERSRF
jgi:hypothetical protein